MAKLKSDFGEQVRRCLDLERQLLSARFAADWLVDADAREAKLRARVARLEEALSEAKENRSPAANKLERMEERLKDLARRQVCKCEGVEDLLWSCVCVYAQMCLSASVVCYLLF